MAAQTIRAMASTRKTKLGHFVVEFCTPGIGHICKSAGCDFVLLDMEHSGFGYDTLKTMLRYMEAAEMPTIVRAPAKEYTFIARACDMGAEGLMLPMVANAEEARRIVSYMKYPPVGIRGVAPQVAHDRYRPGPVVEKLKHANKKTVLFAQIETVSGLDNVEEIAAVPGVDCLWIGHFDLSASMGIPGEFDNPRYTQAVSRIIDAAQANKRALGHLVPTVQEGVRLNELGFDFICYSGDIWVLHNALAAAIGELKSQCKAGVTDMATGDFHVVLSGDFRKPDGSPTFKDFDLEPLRKQRGLRLDYIDPGEEIRAEQVADADALILLTPRFSRASVHPNGRLGVVARFGVGYDNVDVDACTEAGIALTITPDGVRRPVAVAILALMLAVTGKLLTKDKLTREGPDGFRRKTDHMGYGLVGRTLGSLGIGNIGAEMFRLVKPLDMSFIAHDPYADAAVAQSLGVRLVDIETLFRESDVLTINCPLMPQTRHIVNAERLALMKPTAYLINTARGPIVDQRALTQALQERRIAGAGLDVLEKEPPDADDPILRLDNVTFAPHALCWTDQCFAGIGASDVRAVLEIMRGRSPATVVNRAVLETERWKKRLADFAARHGAA